MKAVGIKRFNLIQNIRNKKTFRQETFNTVGYTVTIKNPRHKMVPTNAKQQLEENPWTNRSFFPIDFKFTLPWTRKKVK